MHALNRAKPIFAAKPFESSESIKQISFRNIAQEEQIPKILDEFMDDFEKECLEKENANAKNYSLFAVTSFKIIRTLEVGKKRGLLSAHALNRLNKMFVNHPVKYSKQAIKDPLGLIFVITELAIDIKKNLSIPYEFDQTILDQMTPLLQKYYLQYNNAIGKILEDFSQMPKYKLVIEIGSEHRELIQRFLDYSIAQLSIDIRMQRTKSILEQILSEEQDFVALEYYDTLKLSFSDEELRSHLKKIAQEAPESHKRFANSILEEIKNL